jgi:DNA-binding XRE family transcriptional regulator
MKRDKEIHKILKELSYPVVLPVGVKGNIQEVGISYDLNIICWKLDTGVYPEHTVKKVAFWVGPNDVQAFRLGQKIRQTRLAAKVSQAELAETCGLRVATISKVETETGKISMSTLLKVLEAMDLTIEFV